MKILIISHEHPPVGGGGGNAARHIATNLAQKLGDSVIFLTSHYDGLPYRETRDGYEIIRIDIGRKSSTGATAFEWIKFAFKGLSYLKNNWNKIKPDVTIAFFSLPAGFIAWKLKKIYNIKYIVSLRGADVPVFCPKN